MQDRFRFRAWNKIKQNYDYNIQECEKIFCKRILKDKCFACFQNYLDHQEDFELEQCTGLRDKNSKLIYEGDIVSVPEFYNDIPTGKNSLHKVMYKHAAFNIHGVNTACLEVVGNIHENSELLKNNQC